MSEVAASTGSGALEGAGTGAAVGSVVPGIGTAIGAAGGAIVGGAIGFFSGESAQNQANAEGSAAEEQLQQAQLAEGFAAPTAGELQTLQNQIQLYNSAYASSTANIAQLEQQLTTNYGPNVMQMGQQLYSQLTGGQSQAYSSAVQQRSTQRQNLVSSLTAQYGPGAASSATGMQALQNFDLQTAQYLSGVQTQSINDLTKNMGSLNQQESSLVNDVSGTYGKLDSILGGIQSTQNTFQTRQMQAAMGVVPYAGANQVSNIITSQNQQKMAQSAMSSLGQIAGSTVIANAGATNAAGTALDGSSQASQDYFNNANPFGAQPAGTVNPNGMGSAFAPGATPSNWSVGSGGAPSTFGGFAGSNTNPTGYTSSGGYNTSFGSMFGTPGANQ